MNTNMTSQQLFTHAVVNNQINDNSSENRKANLSMLQKLNEMMSMIDDIFLFGEQIKDGNYLKLVNYLRDFRRGWREKAKEITELPQVHTAILSVLRRNPRSITIQQKQTSDEWSNCKKCNRLVRQDTMDDHQTRDVCRQINEKVIGEVKKHNVSLFDKKYMLIDLYKHRHIGGILYNKSVSSLE